MVKPRTTTQNAALHKYFDQLAEALNDAGYDMRKTLKQSIDIPWTKDSVKNFLWKPIQESMTGEKSTTKLSTVDPSIVYETLNRHTAEKLGVSVPFPSMETMK